MEFFFGKRKTPREMIRENQRLIKKAQRELEREIRGLESQEKRTIMEIKQLANKNQMPAAKLLAKEIVRNRKQVEKLYKLRTQMQSLYLRLQTMASTAAIVDAMKSATSALKRMNNSLNVPEMQALMMEFERQSEMMDMKNEIINDTVEGLVDDEQEEEEQTEELVNKLMDEICFNLSSQMASVPITREQQKIQQPERVAEGGVDDPDLLARFDNLKRN
eukprot:TRINITY_DN2167_c4_g1_i1.p1 TRINITY_DN2167_c4_g1~~TRINITY_DN2167_c4_g1_i1.p1  ORF type:complete len:233 (-),score=106.65 TRINITY_DN2167_c4_g1_i1:32-688(-)